MKSVAEGSPTLKERQFLELLKDVFVWARIEGESGFINLLHIKSRYLDAVLSQILGMIQERIKDFPGFKDDMFDKLYTFFKTYFSETGSIYSSNISLKSQIYEKIYSKDEDWLEEIFRGFEIHNEADYFINKDARSFLKEQFDLWPIGYLLDIRTEFTERRLKKIGLLKQTAYKIIDFVAQFEDGLVQIWDKPKFVLENNYVITLDRIADKEGGAEVIDKIMRHGGFQEQVGEWEKLGFLQTSKGEAASSALMTRTPDIQVRALLSLLLSRTIIDSPSTLIFHLIQLLDLMLGDVK